MWIMEDMKAFISATPDTPIIADIPMPRINITPSMKGLSKWIATR